MIAYKGFEKGLICRGYKFKMGLNVTEKAKAKSCGFHCAENPLDCLSYYSNMSGSDYYIVDAGGDINEDGLDTKISCTELTIIKKLSKEDFILHSLAYMVDHPKRGWNGNVKKDRAEASFNGFAIARGKDPIAKGNKGSILAFVKESGDGTIAEISMTVVDGNKIKADTWYGVDFTERMVDADD